MRSSSEVQKWQKWRKWRECQILFQNNRILYLWSGKVCKKILTRAHAQLYRLRTQNEGRANFFQKLNIQKWRKRLDYQHRSKTSINWNWILLILVLETLHWKTGVFPKLVLNRVAPALDEDWCPESIDEASTNLYHLQKYTWKAGRLSKTKSLTELNPRLRTLSFACQTKLLGNNSSNCSDSLIDVSS